MNVYIRRGTWNRCHLVCAKIGLNQMTQPGVVRFNAEREAADVTVCLHFSTQLLRNRIHATTETGVQGASGKYSVLHYIESRFYRITERSVCRMNGENISSGCEV